MKPTFKIGDYVGFNSTAVDAVVVEVDSDSDPVEYKVELLDGVWRRKQDGYETASDALLNELSRAYEGGSYHPNQCDQDPESEDSDMDLPGDIDTYELNSGFITLPENSTQGEDKRNGNSNYLTASAKENIALYEASQTAEAA